MDFKQASQLRQMQISDLEECGDKAYHNAKLYKEKTKMGWQDI
jgi:hypothetical protein